ncbi:hypothetical protein I6E29_06460 [Arcanobacterium haemolyticum]|nr:hypothetical protein [Arcanobacterium haemolyticum]
MMSNSKRSYTYFVCVLLVALSACSPTDSPSAQENTQEPSDDPTINGLTVGRDDSGKRYWIVPEKTDADRDRELREQYGLVGRTDIPSYTDIQFVEYRDDVGKNFTDCWAQFGFPWTREGEREWHISVPPEQVDASNKVGYMCEWMYPEDPATRHDPYTERQVERLYEWQTSSGRQCYESHGVPVPDPPSTEHFIDDWFDDLGFDTWWLADFARSKPDSFVEDTCPIIPEDVYEY